MKSRLLIALFVSPLLLAGCKGTDGEKSPRGREVQSGFAEVSGGRLYYEVKGSGDALVLIHGNEGDRRHWDHQFDAFAHVFRVVSYDIRGFGKSSLVVGLLSL